MNYFTSIRPFESEKSGKGKNTKKIEYLKNEKSFFNEIKGYNLVGKNKKLIKSSWYKLYTVTLNQFYCLSFGTISEKSNDPL